jgi:hypothetical protein
VSFCCDRGLRRGRTPKRGVIRPSGPIPPAQFGLTARVWEPSGRCLHRMGNWSGDWFPAGVGHVSGPVLAACRSLLNKYELLTDVEPIDQRGDGQEVNEYDQEELQDLLLSGEFPLPLRSPDDVNQSQDHHDQ